ncbi:MAG: TasA family protein [Dehalococcoidia bacterium]
MHLSQFSKRTLAGIGGVGLLVISFASAAVTTAVFADTAAVAGNAFTTGSVDIATQPANSVVNFANMMPGDGVTAPLSVENNGSAELRYAWTTSASNADSLNLRDQLVLEIRFQDVGGGCAAFNGAVVSAAEPLANGGFGSAATGSQPGDRTLASGASEDLCVRVSLPLSTGNAFQGASTTATFTFDAEQTANNP